MTPPRATATPSSKPASRGHPAPYSRAHRIKYPNSNAIPMVAHIRDRLADRAIVQEKCSMDHDILLSRIYLAPRWPIRTAV